MWHDLLADARLWTLLLAIDRELATKARTAACPVCGGPLHSARYPRKPRGGPPAELASEYARRESFCCAVEECRRRVTPPSLRFLGRRVYLGAVVVLVSAMTAGVTAKRASAMHKLVGVSIRTLNRWRAWWLRTFPRTAFWRGARACFASPVDEHALPASLLKQFGGDPREAIVDCLRFLAPLTTSGGCAMAQ